MYSKKTLDAYYFTTPGFYALFIPVKVPYKQIYSTAAAAGIKLKESAGPILESGKMLGFGWIGVEIEGALLDRANVTHISGEFDMYEHQGPYKTIGKAYKKIMKERPKAKQYLNLYLDDPEKTAPEKCRTQILFR